MFLSYFRMSNLQSAYLQGLSIEHKALYSAKLEHLDGLDPYTLKQADLAASLDEVPKVTKSRILDFLLFKTSPFTQKGRVIFQASLVTGTCWQILYKKRKF